MKKFYLIVLLLLYSIINTTKACCILRENKEIYDTSDVIFIGKEKDRKTLELTGIFSTFDQVFSNDETVKITVDVIKPIK